MAIKIKPSETTYLSGRQTKYTQAFMYFPFAFPLLSNMSRTKKARWGHQRAKFEVKTIRM